jgi:hypothetical protein
MSGNVDARPLPYRCIDAVDCGNWKMTFRVCVTLR